MVQEKRDAARAEHNPARERFLSCKALYDKKVEPDMRWQPPDHSIWAHVPYPIIMTSGCGVGHAHVSATIDADSNGCSCAASFPALQQICPH